MNTSQMSFQVSVLAENFAAHWTGGPSLVGVQVPLVGDFLPIFPRTDFAHKYFLSIARAAVTFVVIDFAQNKSTLVTMMRNLIGALAQLIHIDVFYVCEQLSLASKSDSQLDRTFNIVCFCNYFSKCLTRVWLHLPVRIVLFSRNYHGAFLLH
jgi:hypothetical protein